MHPVSHQLDLHSWFIEPIPNPNPALSWSGKIRVWGLPKRADEQLRGIVKWWRSSTVLKCVSATRLVTQRGTLVRLKGGICKEYAERLDMTPLIISKFARGFPKKWKLFLNSCYAETCQRRRLHDENRDDSRKNPSEPPQKRASGKPKAPPVIARRTSPRLSIANNESNNSRKRKMCDDAPLQSPTKAARRSIDNMDSPNKSAARDKKPSRNTKSKQGALQKSVPLAKKRMSCKENVAPVLKGKKTTGPQPSKIMKDKVKKGTSSSKTKKKENPAPPTRRARTRSASAAEHWKVDTHTTGGSCRPVRSCRIAKIEKDDNQSKRGSGGVKGTAHPPAGTKRKLLQRTKTKPAKNTKSTKRDKTNLHEMSKSETGTRAGESTLDEDPASITPFSSEQNPSRGLVNEEQRLLRRKLNIPKRVGFAEPKVIRFHSDSPQAHSQTPLKRPRRRVSFASPPSVPKVKGTPFPPKLDSLESIPKSWTASQKQAITYQMSVIQPDIPHYWDIIAESVPGKNAEQCRIYIENEEVAKSSPRPVHTPVRVQSLAPSSKTLSTPELVQHVQKAARNKRARNTAKFRTNLRHLADTVARETQDELLEPHIATPKMAALTPKSHIVHGLASGTPGTEVRQKLKDAERGGTIATPDIIARGKNFGLSEADRYVSLFKRRLGTADVRNFDSRPNQSITTKRNAKKSIDFSIAEAVVDESESSGNDVHVDGNESDDSDLFF